MCMCVKGSTLLYVCACVYVFVFIQNGEKNNNKRICVLLLLPRNRIIGRGINRHIPINGRYRGWSLEVTILLEILLEILMKISMRIIQEIEVPIK